jgi:hypothetical protein
MSKLASLKLAMPVLALLLVLPSIAAYADDQKDPDGQTPVMYLGKVPITGNKNIFLTLQSIKVALQRPFSTRPEDVNLVVCRIDNVTGERLEYLDCDFNGDYTRQRDESKLAAITAQSHGNQATIGMGDAVDATAGQLMFQSLISVQPNHRLHIPINGGNLMKLLETIPMPSPDQQDAPAAAAPAAGTSSNPGL